MVTRALLSRSSSLSRAARRMALREMFESLKWTPAREAESAGALVCLSRDTDNRRKCGEAAQALWPAMDARTAGATQGADLQS